MSSSQFFPQQLPRRSPHVAKMRLPRLYKPTLFKGYKSADKLSKKKLLLTGKSELKPSPKRVKKQVKPETDEIVGIDKRARSIFQFKKSSIGSMNSVKQHIKLKSSKGPSLLDLASRPSNNIHFVNHFKKTRDKSHLGGKLYKTGGLTLSSR